MAQLWRRVARFLRDESGPTSVEYAIMLALIILVCFSAISAIGTTTRNNYNEEIIQSALAKE